MTRQKTRNGFVHYESLIVLFLLCASLTAILYLFTGLSAPTLAAASVTTPFFIAVLWLIRNVILNLFNVHKRE